MTKCHRILEFIIYEHLEVETYVRSFAFYLCVNSEVNVTVLTCLVSVCA